MDKLLAWIWYSQLFSYGSARASELLQKVSPEELCKCKNESLEQFHLNAREINAVVHTSFRRAEMILEECQKSGIQILPFCHEEYPRPLKEIYAPPVLLYAKGDLSWFEQFPALAVVGTRTPSEYGLRVTGNLCYELAKAGMTIVSGCAVGIDARAHQGALKANGKTVAVLGCGLDVDYPVENQQLKTAILDHGGVLLSELPPGTPPRPGNFPVRNRLIAGLSLGTLVTEAPQKSGALITASHSLESGKDVFCVPPHDLYDPQYQGVSSFIRDGAVTVCSVYDILREYAHRYPHRLDATVMKEAVKLKQVSSTAAVFSKQKSSIFKPDLSNLSDSGQTVSVKKPVWDESLGETPKKIFELLTNQPQLIDEIMLQSGLTMHELLANLTVLEIAGFAVSYSGNSYSLPVHSEK